MQGILLVDKPAGWTSHDVVNYVRKMIARTEGKKPRQVKVGHTGTLDPFATGLLVLLVGKEYTKRAGELSKLDKTYEVTMRLGATSTTGDPEGEIKPLSDTKPSKKALKEALERFTGQIEQVPPAYSAVKVNGRRAYKLAREGKEVKLEPRKVTINRLELVDYTYPDAKLVADVSSGTYIRSLVQDIGSLLGAGAYAKELCRTKVGKYNMEQSTKVQGLSVSDIIEKIKTV
jgi:tRNA pseudouridine55 synthase